MASVQSSGTAFARRDPKEADAFRIDVGGRGGCAEHEIGETLDVGRPLDHDRQFAVTAHIRGGIAGMIDRSDDNIGIGERLGHIVMTDEGAAHAV